MCGQVQCAKTPRNAVSDAAAGEVESSRREVLWAWGSLLVLVICWDAAVRLDEHVSLPRVRLAHAVEREVGESSVQTSPRFE